MIEFRDQLGLWRALQQYRVEGRLYTLRACSSVTVLGHNSETVVRGGDGVMDWFEVTVARERSKTTTGDGPTDCGEGCNGPLTGLEREENAPTVVSCNVRFLASRSVC